ncbi:hypothetical protein LTR97_003929 [Elasticomyces elasticus]|uniref:Auxiliary Activity family 9 catalytic domain-containing protein n=1 Tax=Elasticomyces elasticus TaxID=574655 RepID=A0AAN7W8M7_9PEZI|nr:hypothetical protein LTR97_003929 [Elasticomyces elasticus]
MHSFTIPAIALAAIAVIPSVSAHGYVSGVTSGGKKTTMTGPNWIYQSTKPQDAGWFAYNQDNGFVAPSEYGDQNITCHKGATPGTTSITVAAGSTLDLTWNTWPDSHHGPIIDYLARCSGDCSKQDKSQLNFFKIDAGGLVDGSSAPGKWATDTLLANDFTWKVKIPSNLSGNFVLRHEIIALHSAGNADGAQSYPQCINLKVTGSGTARPCDSGAECRKGPALYKADAPGILINIYTTLTSYSMPGPKIWGSLKKRAISFVA